MQFSVVMTVGSYAALFLVPIAIAIARKNSATTNQTDVVDGTFCFRPHYKMRLFAKQPLTCNLNTVGSSRKERKDGAVGVLFSSHHSSSLLLFPLPSLSPTFFFFFFSFPKANLSTLGGVAIEFFLHSFYCLPKCQLKPDQCNLANFELPPENLLENWFHVKARNENLLVK